MASERVRGYVLGAVAAASYGLNPLFALPMYAAGMGADSVLFYRYVLAVALLGALMLVRRRSFALHRRDVVPLVVMGLLMSASSLLLFESYHFMDAGVASTILFVYPVMVAVIMAVGFHERLTAASVLWSSSRPSRMPSTTWGSTARRCARCPPRSSPSTACSSVR